jgi:DNA-binding NtrC family response regulator
MVLDERVTAPALVDPDALEGEAAFLVVFDEDTAQRRVLPDGCDILIGRAETADLRIRSLSVSRRHARVTVRGGEARIADLGSQNGVKVNGVAITEEQVLRSRDMITLGTVALLYTGHARAAAPAPLVEARAPEPAAVTRAVGLPGGTILLADPVMVRVYEMLERLGAHDLPIVIGGETGTGKELAASAVHQFSPRRGRAFVALNCATVPENLAESELFGHERGAFSGAAGPKSGLLESAPGGTVFLDEIGELSPAIQAKLLRVLETGRLRRLGDVKERDIDIRIIAATNRDLETEARAGRFRDDLFFRLSVASVYLPPLRDRPREILLLAERFLADACARIGAAPMSLSPAAAHVLLGYRWPGNIRELKNTIEYVAVTGAGQVVEPDHLPRRMQPARPRRPPAQPSEGPPTFRPLDDEVRELERDRIAAALEACHGNQTRAAELIGMARRTFIERMKLYALAPAPKASRRSS